MNQSLSVGDLNVYLHRSRSRAYGWHPDDSKVEIPPESDFFSLNFESGQNQ